MAAPTKNMFLTKSSAYVAVKDPKICKFVAIDLMLLSKYHKLRSTDLLMARDHLICQILNMSIYITNRTHIYIYI